MSGLGCFSLLIVFLISDARSSDVDYEVFPENISVCHNPQPPYIKRRAFLSEFNIYKRGQKMYVSARHRVVAEVPFTNLSVHSFKVDDSGKREPLLRLDKVNCRGWMAKWSLNIAGFRFNKHTCLLKKGTYEFKDLDLNKLAHAMPNWHAEGRQLHSWFMVLNGATVFCYNSVLVFKNL